MRGARSALRRRERGGLAREPGGVRLLRQQAAHDGRGRDRDDRGPRGQGAPRLRAQPGPRTGHGLAGPRQARLQLPALGHRLRARCRAARAPGRDAGRPQARRRPLPRGAQRRRGARPALRGAGRDAARMVRVRRAAARGLRARRDDPRAGGARHPEQALPARDPPDELLPRALRPPRGRVPGLRGRGSALDRAALLPRDEPRASSSGSPRSCARSSRAPRHRIRAGVALPRAPGSGLRAAEHVAGLRPPPVAAGRGAVARPRGDARGARDRLRGRPRRAAGRPRRRGGRAARRHLPVRGGRRRHPHGDRAAADRDRGTGRRAPSHGALAQRPGRHGPLDVHARGGRARRAARAPS